MKIILLLLFTGFSVFSHSQQSKNLISFNGIGDLKLGMSLAEAEKLLQVKLTLKHIGIDDELEDTFDVKYQGRDLRIFLKEAYDNKPAVAIVSKVHTQNSLFRTSQGLGIGSERSKIISALSENTLHAGPDYVENKYPERSKTRASIIVVNNEENTHVIIFRLNLKKVISVEVNDYHDWY